MGKSDLITESTVIDYALLDYRKSILEDKERINKRLAEVNVELVKASEDGDRSENAAFEQALRDMAELTSDLNSAESQIGAIERCQAGAAAYKSGAVVADYTTVKIQRRKFSSGKELTGIEDTYIYKLFPYGISQPEKGILSSTESVVGIQLIDKKVGDEIKMKSNTTGAVATYVIEEFY